MTDPIQILTEWPPKIAVCVGAVVLQGDQALFVRQAKGQPLAGQWSIPWGVMEPNETPEAAALRETHEEAAIEAEIGGLLGIQNLSDQGWLAIIFLCRHAGGVPVSDGGLETDQAAYFSLEQMNRFDEPFEVWCDWLVRRVLQGNKQVIPAVFDNPYQPRLAFL